MADPLETCYSPTCVIIPNFVARGSLENFGTSGAQSLGIGGDARNMLVPTRRSRSNRLGVDRWSQKVWGTLGLVPWGGSIADPLETCFSFTCVIMPKFGRSRSNRTIK